MAPARTRRTQAERRRDTQERILAATIEVLSQEGHTRFTTTRVAQSAGVSRGALENYFPTKTALLAAATAHAMDLAAEQAAASAQSVARDGDVPRAFLAETMTFFLSPNYVAMEELALAGRDDAALSDIHRAAFDRFRKVHDRIWISALVAAGYDRRNADAFVEMTIYFLRGIALTELILPKRPRAKALLSRWSALALPLLGHSGHK